MPKAATVSAILLCVVATKLRADAAVDDFLSLPRMSETIGQLASFAFSYTTQHPEHDKAELRKNYWAFMSDVTLTPEQLAAAEKRYDEMWAELQRVTADRGVTAISFIGIDNVGGIAKRYDLYYMAATLKGPVLLRYSVVFGTGKPRVMDIRPCADWDKVKEIAHNIQHRTDPNRTPTISLKREAEPAKNP